MNISILGTGNVATILGKYLLQHKHTIINVWGRDIEKTTALANTLKAKPCNTFNTLNTCTHTQLFIIAVKDNAIEQVAKQLNTNTAIVVHTAAAIDINVLQNSSKNYGVFYPLQSLNASNKHIVKTIPFIVQANNIQTSHTLLNLANSISTGVEGDINYRVKLHTAAVLVSNFTNYLYSEAYDFCTAESIDFSILQPLIQETAGRLTYNNPNQVQTGPAVRNDEITLQKHTKILKPYPQLLKVYQFLSTSILNKFNTEK